MIKQESSSVSKLLDLVLPDPHPLGGTPLSTSDDRAPSMKAERIHRCIRIQAVEKQSVPCMEHTHSYTCKKALRYCKSYRIGSFFVQDAVCLLQISLRSCKLKQCGQIGYS